VALERTRSGDFHSGQARTIADLEVLAAEGRLGEAVIPPRDLLPEFPSEAVDSLTATQIRQGRDFRVSPFRQRVAARYVKAISPEGDLVAIGEVTISHLYHPVLVM
jgi:tRNA pseudouridine55 synthase